MLWNFSYFTLAGELATVPWKTNHSNFSERGFPDNKLAPHRNEKLAIDQQCNSWQVPFRDKVGVWAIFWDVLAKLGAQICVIEASSRYGVIQMFFAESKCLIWVTTCKVSSGFPQDYVVIFVFLSHVLNFGRFWHATFWQTSQGHLEEMYYLSRRSVYDIGTVHEL